MNTPGQRNRPRVFLSYASPDKSTAEELASALSAAGYEPWLDRASLQPGTSLEKSLREALQTSDVFVALISSGTERGKWSSWELAEATRPQHRARRMAILPVLIGDAQAPADLDAWQSVPLRGTDGVIGTPVLAALSRLTAIDFSALDPGRLESLVADLLPELGFSSVRRAERVHDPHFDFEARLTLPDPFGSQREEVWMIEVKHHRTSRVSTAVIAELAGRVMFLPAEWRAVVITSGTLTTAARDFLDRAVRERSLNLRVIESNELRDLVARFPTLVHRYFSSDAAAG